MRMRRTRSAESSQGNDLNKPVPFKEGRARASPSRVKCHKTIATSHRSYSTYDKHIALTPGESFYQEQETWMDVCLQYIGFIILLSLCAYIAHRCNLFTHVEHVQQNMNQHAEGVVNQALTFVNEYFFDAPVQTSPQPNKVEDIMRNPIHFLQNMFEDF